MISGNYLSLIRELKEVNEQLEEFAFVSSHDLQEPLRKIQAFSSYLALPEANLNAFAKKYSQKINTSSARMSTLIKDLLSFSLLSQVDKKLVKIDLNETIKNVLADFELIIKEKKSVVNLSALPTVHASPIHMSQLFHNLIGNALKFGKENSTINITAEKVTRENIAKYKLNEDKQYVAIMVNDNGIGFNQKYASKAFGLFQRLHNIEGVAGSGVGLTICKKIVEDIGGLIMAKGIENVGSTFTVILPVKPGVAN